MAAAVDVPLLIISDNARSERRISPAWTIAQLKGRLEPITGIPASSQRLVLKVASWPDQNLQTVDEDNTQLGVFTLQSYAELYVSHSFHCFINCMCRADSAGQGTLDFLIRTLERPYSPTNLRLKRLNLHRSGSKDKTTVPS